MSRNIDSDDYQAGTPITVTLTATTRSGQTVTATVNETQPALSTISSPNASAGTVQTTNNGLVWNLDSFTGTATLTYTITLSANLNSVSFPGTFNYSNSNLPNSYLGGDIVLPKVPTRGLGGPVELDASKPVVVQIEAGTVVGDGISGDPERPAFGLAVNPGILGDYRDRDGWQRCTRRS